MKMTATDIKYNVHTPLLWQLKIAVIIISYMLWSIGVDAQNQQPWDDQSASPWPSSTALIQVESSLDGALQHSYIYRSTSAAAKPLIISLHTWGGNYQQKDPLLPYCIAADLNYMHPDFRGPNTHPDAGGSERVVQDIDDIIDWALQNMQVDTQQIHIVGVSGGAFATLMSYMHSKHNIQSFHAFVGIYNLEHWYYESLMRNKRYADDIVALTGGKDGTPNLSEAHKRSPLMLSTPTLKRHNSSLRLYAGIHDGYTGSVPISHTLEMYNKVVMDFSPEDNAHIIPMEDRYLLLKRRIIAPDQVQRNAFLGRDIIFRKSFKDLVQVLIFEGGHELPEGDFIAYLLREQERRR